MMENIYIYMSVCVYVCVCTVSYYHNLIESRNYELLSIG